LRLGFRFRRARISVIIKKHQESKKSTTTGRGKGVRIFKNTAVFALILAAFLAAARPAAAGDWSPVQLALWHPAQAVPADFAIYGLRANLIYGKNREVRGLDLGLANTSKQDTWGIQAGILNGPGKLFGLGVGGINSSGSVHGMQAGLLGVSEGRVNGVQVSALYSQAKTVRGLQIGLINSAENLKGLQIGLINRVKDGPVPFLPILYPGF
jgi:hypothetical protein